MADNPLTYRIFLGGDAERYRDEMQKQFESVNRGGNSLNGLVARWEIVDDRKQADAYCVMGFHPRFDLLETDVPTLTDDPLAQTRQFRHLVALATTHTAADLISGLETIEDLIARQTLRAKLKEGETEEDPSAGGGWLTGAGGSTLLQTDFSTIDDDDLPELDDAFTLGASRPEAPAQSDLARPAAQEAEPAARPQEAEPEPKIKPQEPAPAESSEQPKPAPQAQVPGPEPAKIEEAQAALEPAPAEPGPATQPAAAAAAPAPALAKRQAPTASGADGASAPEPSAPAPAPAPAEAAGAPSGPEAAPRGAGKRSIPFVYIIRDARSPLSLAWADDVAHYDPKRRRFFSANPDAGALVSKILKTPPSIKPATEIRDDLPFISYDSLMWSYGLRTRPSRSFVVNAGVEKNKFKLKKWPLFGQWETQSELILLSTLLTQKFSSTAEVSYRSGVPKDEVVRFLYAAYLANIPIDRLALSDEELRAAAEVGQKETKRRIKTVGWIDELRQKLNMQDFL